MHDRLLYERVYDLEVDLRDLSELVVTLKNQLNDHLLYQDELERRIAWLER